jgi:hypothetical protein
MSQFAVVMTYHPVWPHVFTVEIKEADEKRVVLCYRILEVNKYFCYYSHNIICVLNTPTYAYYIHTRASAYVQKDQLAQGVEPLTREQLQTAKRELEGDVQQMRDFFLNRQQEVCFSYYIGLDCSTHFCSCGTEWHWSTENSNAFTMRSKILDMLATLLQVATGAHRTFN